MKLVRGTGAVGAAGLVRRTGALAGAADTLARAAGLVRRTGAAGAADTLARAAGLVWRTGALALLLAAGCAPADAAEETGGTSEESGEEGSSGDGPDLCPGVTCGAAATCAPHDGRCYCDRGHHGDPDVGCATYPDYCGDAEAALGHGVCVFEIDDEATWIDRSDAGVEALGLRWMGKYLAPISPASPLPTLFGDRSYYNLHICMLQEAFQDVLPGFTNADYLELVYYRASRTMIAGSVYELVKDDLAVRYVFTVEVPEATYELLRVDEVYAVYRLLQDRFRVGELGYFPRNAAQQGSALTWKDPGFPVLFNTGAQEPKPEKCQ